jgi:hypothetical protein
MGDVRRPPLGLHGIADFILYITILQRTGRIRGCIDARAIKGRDKKGMAFRFIINNTLFP